MCPRAIAQALALGRVAVGVGLLAAPRLAAGWIGGDARRPGTQVTTRALAARDLALGLGVLAAAREATPMRRWLQVGVIADGTDLAASLAAGDGIPRPGGRLVAAVAATATLTGAWLSVVADRSL